jgi:3-dehydroquinate dehydratase-2
MILILNGPNLNWVGKREPDVYGTESLEEYLKGFGTTVTVHFSNIEGELINALQEAENNNSISAIILNAGGYSHTSIAIADTIRAMRKPVVSVHISNIFDRELERHKDLVSAASSGFIGGFGLRSYDLAVHALSETTNP